MESLPSFWFIHTGTEQEEKTGMETHEHTLGEHFIRYLLDLLSVLLQ